MQRKRFVGKLLCLVADPMIGLVLDVRMFFRGRLALLRFSSIGPMDIVRQPALRESARWISTNA